jgi:hypothetical protein
LLVLESSGKTIFARDKKKLDHPNIIHKYILSNHGCLWMDAGHSIPYFGMELVDKCRYLTGSTYWVQQSRFPVVTLSTLVYIRYTDPLCLRLFECLYYPVLFILKTKALYFFILSDVSEHAAFQQYNYSGTAIITSSTNNQQDSAIYLQVPYQYKECLHVARREAGCVRLKRNCQ